jgi:hypothetical protein
MFRRKYEINIKMVLKEEYVDWIYLTHEMCLYRAFMKTIMKLCVPQKNELFDQLSNLQGISRKPIFSIFMLVT